MNIIFRWAILAFSIFLVERLLEGIEAKEKGWYVYVIMALIMALLNIFLKPVLKFLSCPLIILTLGLFSLVINA
ncbi:MAG: phage holin family protein, partial [Thermoanaerobaculia bacterium]